MFCCNIFRDVSSYPSFSLYFAHCNLWIPVTALKGFQKPCRIVLQDHRKRFQGSKVSFLLFFFCARAEHCMKAELQVGDASPASHPQHLMTVIISVTMTTTGCSTVGSVVLPTRSHSCTWDKNGQQLLDGVHGGDEHLPVLLVRQLLLPLLNHLWHFRHPWRKRRKTEIF